MEMRKTAFVWWTGLSLLLGLAAIGFWSGSSGTAFAQQPSDTIVTFPDRGLEAVIRNTIGKPTGPIYMSDLAALTSLRTIRTQIYDLTGLEHCTSLLGLYLNGNKISDISPLAGLTKLEVLDLSFNRMISDISPLAGLTNIRYLTLSNNKISDISPLAGLFNLKEVKLSRNSINDISPLAGLDSLENLDLSDNKISNISPLAGLTNLKEVKLSRNSISDISPMLSPKWLSRRYHVDLSVNPLSTASRRFGILLLQQTGVSVTSHYPWAFPDWSFIPGSLIAWAGVGFTAICYLTASRRRKWLRPAALVVGVLGAF